MRSWKLAVSFVPLIIIAACSDVATVPTQSTEAAEESVVGPAKSPDGAARHSISTGSQAPPASVPPEYQHYTSVNTRVDVGFTGNTAYAGAIVDYSGNNGSATIKLVARNKAGSIVGENSGQTVQSYVFPSSHTVKASTTVLLTSSCGHTAQANAIGEVWDSFFTASQSTLTWGKQREDASRSAAQAACPVVTEPTVCKSPSLLGPNYDCDSPTGGDGSTQPSSGTPPPEPPTYVEPYYPPKSGQYNCTTIWGGTDYEQYVCWWVENNDARIANGAAPRSAFRAGASSVSAAAGARLPSVFVVVSDEVPAGAMAVVERRKEGPYKNVLLVPSAGFRPAELVRAMRYLYASRAAHGETPAREFSAQLKGAVGDAEVSAAAREYAATFTALLGKAKGGSAGPRGTRPFLEIRMADAPAR